MEGLEQFITTELGAVLICIVLIAREIKIVLIEWIRAKKGMGNKRECDEHIQNIYDEIAEINKKLPESEGGQ